MSRNGELAALMRSAGYLRDDGSIGLKAFARAVGDATRELGGPREFTHTYVRRWLDGRTPRDELTRQAIAYALSRRLGRSIAGDELGFAARDLVPADVALSYPSSLDDGLGALGTLLQADVEDVRAVVASEPNTNAWNEAALAWVIRRPGQPHEAGREPAHRAAARVRTTLDMFARLDNQYGGGHSRGPLIHFLRTDVRPLLRVQGHPDPELLAAVAAAVHTAAWMSYDVGLHGLAQRYFIQALGLADAADDDLLAATTLDAMSHQATYLGRYREAAMMAGAALTGTTGKATPTLRAHFHVMEARALARLGDAASCDRSLAAAVVEFDRRRPDDDPAWISYFDEAELAAELGHCTRDLGRGPAATTYAAHSLDSAGGEYLRSDFFAALVLADAYLDQGEVEEGCRVALQALDAGDQISSERCAVYLAEFRGRLAGFAGTAAVADFTAQAGTHALWDASGSVRQPVAAR